MPLQGSCPDPDCEGTYNVRRALRESVATRMPPARPGPLCPACGREIPARWGRCHGCGRFVTGRYTFRPWDLLLAAALFALAVLWLIYRGPGP